MDAEELRRRIIKDEDVPSVVREFLSKGASLEEIRLDSRGRWSHEGEPFDNQRLSTLFGRSLRRTSQGNWILEIPPYTYPVIVESFGWFIIRIDETRQGWRADLSNGEQAAIATDGLMTDGDTVLAATLLDGRTARLIGSAHQSVLDRVDGEVGSWRVRWGNDWIPIRDAGDDFCHE